MNILNYDSVTGEFLSQSQATENPKKAGVFLLPANAVYENKYPLPALGINEVAVWNNGWVVTPDFRGFTFWIENGEGVQIKEIDTLVPTEATLTTPPTIDSVLDAGVWRDLTPTEIDAAKTIKADIESRFDPTLKAFALVVLSEINALRVAAGLPTRTVQQLKNAVKAKL